MHTFLMKKLKHQQRSLPKGVKIYGDTPENTVYAAIAIQPGYHIERAIENLNLNPEQVATKLGLELE
jgi:hypothetical protein